MNELVSRRAGQDGSERLRLARLVRDAALSVSGVVATDPGPNGLVVTVAGGQRLEGVLCAATKDDGYDITLRLVCRLVPLPALSEQVKGAARRAAATAGLPVESVSVHVAELIDGEDSRC